MFRNPASRAQARREGFFRQEQAQRLKAQREVNADSEFMNSERPGVEQILRDLEQRRKVPVKTLREIDAEHQVHQAVMLGQAALFLISFGWADDAGYFARSAFQKARNAYMTLNPDPELVAAHKEFLLKNGCVPPVEKRVDFNAS